MPMFRTEIEDGSSFLAFIFQQLGVWLVFAFWGAIGSGWLARLNGLGPAANSLEALGNVTAGLVPAFFVGRLVQAKLAHFAYSGRWLWLLPGALLAALLVSAALNARLSEDLADFLYPPNEPEAFWAVVFGLYPTMGCVGYSFGIWFQARRSSS
jgi:hypothetical protein